MRTYRCTAAECAETFDVERHRDVGMPGSVHCVFCGKIAPAAPTWEGAKGIVAGQGHAREGMLEPHAAYREQGRQAAREGRPLSANPHLGGKGGKRWRAWAEGWREVMEEPVVHGSRER